MAIEQKNLPTNLEITTEQQIELAKKAWASPNTALGVSYGLFGYAVGAATGKDVKITFGNNAIQFEGNPINPFDENGAITLGNAINYVGKAKPDDITRSYAANYKLQQIYDGAVNKEDFYFWYQNFYETPESEKVLLGKHEQEHTYQTQILGPLFLPIYLMNGNAPLF